MQIADAIRFVASYLEPLKGGKVPIEILVRGKDPEENKKQFESCLENIKKAGVSPFDFHATLRR